MHFVRAALAIGLMHCCTISPAQPTYSILSYNIRYDNPGDGPDRWDRRKKVIAKTVEELQPAVVGLQEVLVHQAEYLDAEWPGYRRFGVGRDDGAEEGEFAPVYFDTTVFRLIAGRTLWLSETPNRPSVGWDASCKRIATWVMLADRTTGDSICLVNTHWDHIGSSARRFSAFMMKGAMSAAIASGTPAVVMGDLNAAPESEEIGIMAQWFEDTCPDSLSAAPTFNHFGPDSLATDRIDYIWRSPDHWQVLEYRVLSPKSAGRQASDHYPVLVRLAPNPKR